MTELPAPADEVAAEAAQPDAAATRAVTSADGVSAQHIPPGPPARHPPLPSHPLALWETARPAFRPIELRHLEALAAEHDPPTGGYGLYWIGRAILAATVSRDVESVAVIKAIMERWRTESAYGSDAPGRPQRRPKEQHETPHNGGNARPAYYLHRRSTG